MAYADKFRAGLMGPAHVQRLERFITVSDRAPTTSADSNDGYFVGCRWFVDNGDEYVCKGAAPGNANWVKVLYTTAPGTGTGTQTGTGDGTTTTPGTGTGNTGGNTGGGTTTPPVSNLTGGFSTDGGNQILDGAGNKIQLLGVNVTGFASGARLINGMFAKPWRAQFDQIKALKFNAIRLPFSVAGVRDTSRFTSVPGPNADVVGKTALEFLDMIVDYCTQINLPILLDQHHSSVDGTNNEWGMQRNGLWYETRPSMGYQWSRQEVIDTWVMLATRYRGKGVILGADLHNEPGGQKGENPTQGATWGDGDPAHDWPLWCEQCAEAILTANPDWLIVVEGIEYSNTPFGPWYNPGSNLAAYASRPISLRRRDAQGNLVAVTNKLVLSAHPYGPGLASNYHRFQASEGFPDSLPATWEGIWADKYWNKTAPMIIGEFGSLNEEGGVAWPSTDSRVVYDNRLLKYCSGIRNPAGSTNVLANGDKGISWFRWEWCDYSGDTGGIVSTNDFTSVNASRYNQLKPYLDANTQVIVLPSGSTAPTGGGQTPPPPASTWPRVPNTLTGAKRYVDAAQGNDSNPGTQAAPWRTLSKAVAAAVAGDTVIFADGNYDGNVVQSANGTAANPIVFVAANRNGAKIRQVPGATVDTAVEVRGNFVQLHGFEVDGTSYSSGTRWRMGLYFRGSDSGAYYCKVHDLQRQAGGQSVAGAGIFTDGYYGGLRHTIEGCEVYNIGPSLQTSSVLHGLYMSTTGRCANNLVYACVGCGLECWHSPRDLVIVHNTFYSCYIGCHIGTSTGEEYPAVAYGTPYTGLAANCDVASNIAAWCNYGFAEQDRVGANRYDRNLVFSDTTPWQLVGNTHTNTVAADPLFVNRGANDFRLASGSPAINAAAAAFGPAVDFALTARPISTGYDIGCLESTAPAASGGGTPPASGTVVVTQDFTSGTAPWVASGTGTAVASGGQLVVTPGAAWVVSAQASISGLEAGASYKVEASVTPPALSGGATQLEWMMWDTSGASGYVEVGTPRTVYTVTTTQALSKTITGPANGALEIQVVTNSTNPWSLDNFKITKL